MECWKETVGSCDYSNPLKQPHGAGFPTVMKVRTMQTHSKHHPRVLKLPLKWQKLPPASLWSAQAGCGLSVDLRRRYLPKGQASFQTDHYPTPSRTRALTNPLWNNMRNHTDVSARATANNKVNDNECWRRYGSKEASAATRLAVWSLLAASNKWVTAARERNIKGKERWLVGKLQRSPWLIQGARKY